MSYRQLVEALGAAVEWIAQAQREGCPAGVVAVPSRIRDAYLRGKAALDCPHGRDVDTCGMCQSETERRIGATDGLVWARPHGWDYV